MTRIETTLVFPHGIPCKKEVLGLEHPIIIGSHEGIIAFPNIPEDYPKRIINKAPIDRHLIPPANADMQLSIVETTSDWGHFSDSLGNSCVKSCRIWFPCEYHNANNLGNTLCRITDDYLDNFLLFLEILTKNTFSNDSCGSLKMESFTQYWLWSQSGEITEAEDVSLKLHLSMPENQNYISKDLIELSLTYANKGYKPSTSYKLLRDSIHHKNKNDFRRAILDASTATEIALTNRIIAEFKNKTINNPKYIETILKKFHSISGRIELAEASNIKLPKTKNDYKFLSEVRNKAIHAGHIANLNEFKKIIEIAISTVDEFCIIYES